MVVAELWKLPTVSCICSKWLQTSQLLLSNHPQREESLQHTNSQVRQGNKTSNACDSEVVGQWRMRAPSGVLVENKLTYVTLM